MTEVEKIITDHVWHDILTHKDRVYVAIDDVDKKELAQAIATHYSTKIRPIREVYEKFTPIILYTGENCEKLWDAIQQAVENFEGEK